MPKKSVLIIFISLLASLAAIYYFQSKNESKPEKNSFSIHQLKNCYSDINHCLDTTVPQILDAYPLNEVMTALDENQNDKEIFIMCHEYRITRELGFVAAQKSDDFKTIIRACDGACYEACYHGVAESFLAKLDPSDKVGMTSLCGLQSQYDSRNKFLGCLYGIGRGLMQISENDLTYTLPRCDLYATNLEREGCYSGVFQAASRYYVESADLGYWCNNLDSKYAKVCYAFAGRHFLDTHEYDLIKGINFCKQIPEAYQEECIRQTTGHLVYIQNSYELNESCNKLDHSFKNACVLSIAGYLVQRDGNDINAKLFCSLVERKDECLSKIK
jgi:hypothetical protein